jgi:predicted membrane protein (TIGR00267 family)
MLLGIIVGSAFSGGAAGLNVIILTMLTTSLALGISTGVSVYEAESLEQERKIADLEKALFTDLTDTSLQKTSKYIIIIATFINFATPLLSCTLTITPFLLAAIGILPLDIAGWISVALALSTLFGAGVYMGRTGRTNPYTKGLRMVAFGVLAFVIGYLLNLLI